MKKIIIVSDKYSFCLEGYQALANKHWPDSGKFNVVGFSNPGCTLQDNYEFESLGPLMSDSTPWAQALLPYFKSIKEEFFFLCFEDHFLVSEVNQRLMKRSEEIMRCDESISKIRLLPVRGNGYNVVRGEYDEDFYILNPYGGKNKESFSSLRPSIWRTSTFIDMLSTGHIVTPHNFESRNMSRANSHRGFMLMPKGTRPLYPDLDAFRRGDFHHISLSNQPISGWWGAGSDSFVVSQDDKKVFEKARSDWYTKLCR